jgi:hypothetical protein
LPTNTVATLDLKKVSKLVNLIKNETEVYIVTEEGKENEDHDR